MTYSDYVAAVLADSPAAFWELQDGGDFPQDASGNGNHMDTSSIGTGGSITYRNLSGLAPAGYGPQSSYRVTYRIAYLGRAASLPISGVDNITLEAWTNQAGGQATEPFFGVGAQGFFDNGNAPGTGGYALQTNQAGAVGIIAINGGTFSQFLFAAPPGSLHASGWIHSVAVRRAGVWELWLNGSLSGSGATFAPASPSGTVSPGTWIGGKGSSGSSVTGAVAYAAVYPVALSGARIAAHWNAMAAWPPADFVLDEHPFDVAAGTFTTQGGNGLLPDHSPNQADYPMLSWLQSGGTGTQSPVSGRVRIL